MAEKKEEKESWGKFFLDILIIWGYFIWRLYVALPLRFEQRYGVWSINATNLSKW